MIRSPYTDVCIRYCRRSSAAAAKNWLFSVSTCLGFRAQGLGCRLRLRAQVRWFMVEKPYMRSQDPIMGHLCLSLGPQKVASAAFGSGPGALSRKPYNPLKLPSLQRHDMCISAGVEGLAGSGLASLRALGFVIFLAPEQ